MLCHLGQSSGGQAQVSYSCITQDICAKTMLFHIKDCEHPWTLVTVGFLGTVTRGINIKTFAHCLLLRHSTTLLTKTHCDSLFTTQLSHSISNPETLHSSSPWITPREVLSAWCRDFGTDPRKDTNEGRQGRIGWDLNYSSLN